MAEKYEEPRMAYATLKDGRDVDISTSAIFEHMAKHVKDRQTVNVINATAMGGGLIRLDVDLNELTADRDFHFEEGTQIPTPRMPQSSMRSDVSYYALVPSEDGALAEAELWTCDPTAVVTEKPEAWTFERVDLMMTDTETGERIKATADMTFTHDENGTTTEHTLGELGLDPERLMAPFNEEEGSYLTFGDLILGVYILDASVGVATQRRDDMAAQSPTLYRNLPRQDVRKLHRQNDPVSKVIHVMTNPELFNKKRIVKVDVASTYEKRRGREVRTAVSFSWDGEGVEIYRPISQYDREVHGAVSSLWADGQRVVTPHQIAKAMGIRNPTKKQVESAAESVDLQRRILGNINFTKEARGRDDLTFEGEPVTTFKLEGYLIAADKAEIGTANGRIVEGYILHRAPLMYQHAATLGQVVNYPQKLLELGDGRDTVQNIILRRELLRRVYRIKNKYENARPNKRPEVNRRIRFTPDRKHPERCLFSRAEVNQKNRDARKKAMDYVLGILNELADQGEITDYKPISETGRGGRRVVGVELILCPADQGE